MPAPPPPPFGRSPSPAPRRCTVEEKLVCLVENLPPDQHAADFAGAGADLVELGVAQQAPGRIVVDVAVAAQYLHRVERDLGGALGGVEDRAGGVLAGGLAAVAGARHGVDIGAAGIGGGIH